MMLPPSKRVTTGVAGVPRKSLRKPCSPPISSGWSRMLPSASAPAPWIAGASELSPNRKSPNFVPERPSTRSSRDRIDDADRIVLVGRPVEPAEADEAVRLAGSGDIDVVAALTVGIVWAAVADEYI